MKIKKRQIEFCHLHVHSTYSKLDSICKLRELIVKAKKLNFKYLACTDHGVIDGLIKFQKECEKQGIKSILGIEAYLVKEWKKKEPRGHICFWIKNRKGFKNLCKIVTESNLKGFYYKPRIDYETLLRYHEGLLIGTACIGSFIVRCTDGQKFFKELVRIKKKDIYVEVMPHNIERQISHNKYMISLASKYHLKVILTNDVHYINRKDWKVHEIMLAIQNKAKWTDKNRWKFPNNGYHLRSTKEMINAIKEIGFYKKEYLTNTLEIAQKCSDFIIPKQAIKLPMVPKMKGQNEDKLLWKLCLRGYKKKFNESIKKRALYYKRLKFEYDVIKSKNFSRYFLIVYELCYWCNKQNISIGPRGSVSGSLIAFCLGITSVNPIKHNLIFDRFINKERIDYPDIDIDFPDKKRILIKEHLENLYGKGKIANVTTFNKLKPKAAIQAVARVFDIPPIETNIFTKLIDDKIDDCVQDAIATYSEALEYSQKYPKVIKYAKLLEGNISNYSVHAAALIISIKDIHKTGKCALIEKDGIISINWEKDDAEYVGLMKLDALGLKELTIIDNAIELIKEKHGKTIKLHLINIEDKNVLNDISNGNTVGIFQFNAWASTQLVKEMGIEKFKHLVDAVALVRPGPYNSGMTREYIERKHGKKWKAKNDIYNNITKDTYNVICFQEQIMQIINIIAGLSYSTADKIRKIIGKKRDVSEFDKYYDQFLKGCKKEGHFTVREAEEFWHGLQQHAKYSFNASHAVSYAYMAYYCAWLKHYYPTEFICSSLTYGNKNKKGNLIEEAYRLGLSLKLPKVGVSDPYKWVFENNDLYIPFIEVKGIGNKKAIKASKLPIKQNNNENIRKWVKIDKKDKLIKKHKGSLGELLNKIGAYDNSEIEITKEINNLFDFQIMLNPEKNYTNLYKLFGNNLRQNDIECILKGDSKTIEQTRNKSLIKRTKFDGLDNLHRCTLCNLSKECKRPVHPSIGEYNIMLVGEAPGKFEDMYGKGFYENAKAGRLLWSKIKKRGYKRKHFYVTNCNKCFPKITRTPTTEQIEICGNNYLDIEIKNVKPIIILAFGNTCRQFFEGINNGILSISGDTMWNEKYGCWICWCTHPAHCIRNPKENKIYFNKGMKNFFKLLKSIGFKDEIKKRKRK